MDPLSSDPLVSRPSSTSTPVRRTIMTSNPLMAHSALTQTSTDPSPLPPASSSSTAIAIEEISNTLHRSSTWTRQQQLFGVQLRSTNPSARPIANTVTGATTVATISEHQIPPQPVILHEADQSVRSAAVACFMRKHHIPFERKHVNPMLGISTKEDGPPIIPRLDDGTSLVQGWLNVLKYLTWKYLPPSSNTFYPPVTAATFAQSTTPAPNKSPSVSAFEIDSFLESFHAMQSTLDYLSHAFLQSAMRGGPYTPLAYLNHTFDKDGGLLLPQWKQPIGSRKSSHPDQLAPAPSPTQSSAHRKSNPPSASPRRSPPLPSTAASLLTPAFTDERACIFSIRRSR